MPGRHLARAAHLRHLRPTLDALCLAQYHSADTLQSHHGLREKLNPGAELVVDDKCEDWAS